MSETRPHEVIYDTGHEIVCACGAHMSIYGLTRTKASAFAEHVRDALGSPASSVPATESGQA